jgi:hypothetical protein
MSTTVTTPEELGKALKNGASEIELEGKLADGRVVKLRAVGPVAWAIAIGGIGVAVVAIIVTAGSGGTSSFASVPGAAAGFATATGVLGASAAATAIAVSVAAGGIGALKKLRKDYKVEKRNGKTVLVKK